MTRACLLAALAALALMVAGCGGEESTSERGGLATTSTTSAAGTPPPPTGPLDPLIPDQVGDLVLAEHVGSPTVFDVGAEDARDLTYQSESGPGGVVTVSLWPSEQRAMGYSRKFADLLVSDSGFERRGGVRDFEGPRGPGILIRLTDGEGTEAAIWTSGRLAGNALADRSALRALEGAPFLAAEGGAGG